MKLTMTTALASVLLTAAPALADKAAVLDNYATIALAKYEDSLTSAKALQAAVDNLVANPSAEALQGAKTAWLQARVPYQQTEVYRFGNAIVDDWEGRVNAWPLDEGLIDYVDASYGGATDENSYAVLNVIANPSFRLSGETIDASEITPALLEGELHKADGVEANVATGYHAIEFLLRGQALNGHGPGAGNRPWTDYATGDACTGGNCDRRADDLQAATALLVSDLERRVAQWQGDGEDRTHLIADENAGLSAMPTAMGSLSYGEQAGARMKLGVMLNDSEEEHDCFADNTHNSHFYDAMGIRNVYLDSYTRIDGTVVSGASLSSLVAEKDAGVDAELKAKLDTTMLEMAEMKAAAEAGFAEDMMLERGNEAGEALIMGAIDALVDQTWSIERAVAALGVNAISFEGSDSLDNSNVVFQ
jgi:putative iron-regulated protein